MKITFITGSLSPGKSGVADYVRDLADECEKHGNRCQLIALNDEDVTGVSELDGRTKAGLLRLPSQMAWASRMEFLSRAVNDFDPDLMSIQFVSYGFQRKGLVWKLGNRLRKVCEGRRVHVMFHELWIGEAKDASLKRRVTGAFQKQLILGLIRRLKPGVIHTNCSMYVELLRRNNVIAKRLPLFGSIPIAATFGQRLDSALLEKGLKIDPQTRRKFWLFGMFGSLHPEWKAEPLLSYIVTASRQEGLTPAIIAIGKKGPAGDVVWNQMASKYEDQVRFCDLGEQPAEMVSEALLTLDFGISATPVALIGKSASTTAMLEHGLPVIVTRDDYQTNFSFEPEELKNPMLVRLTPSLVKGLRELRKGPPKASKERVARQFLMAIGAQCRAEIVTETAWR